MATNLENRLAEFERYILAAPSPAHRAMVRNFQEHNRCEQTGDLEGLLELYCDDAEFHVYGTVFGPTRDVHLQGKRAIRERYTRMFEGFVSRAADPVAALELLLTSDWGISGIFCSSFEVPGSVLIASGHELDDAEATYRYAQHLAFFRGFRGGLASSMTYVNSVPTVERIA